MKISAANKFGQFSVWTVWHNFIKLNFRSKQKSEISLSHVWLQFFQLIVVRKHHGARHQPPHQLLVSNVHILIVFIVQRRRQFISYSLWEIRLSLAEQYTHRTIFNVVFCRKINGHRFTMPKTTFYRWKSSAVEPVAAQRMAYRNQYTTHPMKNWPATEPPRCRQSIRHKSTYPGLLRCRCLCGACQCLMWLKFNLKFCFFFSVA